MYGQSCNIYFQIVGYMSVNNFLVNNTYSQIYVFMRVKRYLYSVFEKHKRF